MSKKDLEGAPFVVKTFQLLSETSNRELVSWSETKDSFVVWNPVDFAAEILPKYFKHNNFCSFIRQLNTYGFHKVESKQWEFKHDYFQEGRGDMLRNITRRRSKKRDERDFEEELPPAPSKRILSRSEEVEDKDEVEKLKDLNTLLMKEVVRLQHQQETTNDTIKQILAELISSRQEQREITKKVTEMATTDFKEPYLSKPQTPLSSPASFSSPISVPSSPAIGVNGAPSMIYHQSPQSTRHINAYPFVKPEAPPKQQQQPLLNSYPTFNEIISQNNVPIFHQQQVQQNPTYSQYNQSLQPQNPTKVSQPTVYAPRNEDIIDSYLNHDENFFALDELNTTAFNGDFQAIQSLPNELLSDPYAITFQ